MTKKSACAALALALLAGAATLATTATPGHAGPPADRRNDPIPSALERPQPRASVRSSRPERAGPSPSAVAQPSRVTVTHIEATQAIQDIDHSVPLIGGRAVYVRVFMDLGGPGPNDDSVSVGGMLEVAKANGDTKSYTSDFAAYDPRVRGAQNGNLEARRNDPLSGIVFRLPPEDVKLGEYTISLLTVTDRDGARQLECTSCAQVSRTIKIVEPAPPLRLSVIGISYKINAKTFEPRPVDFAMIPSWIKRAYPISDMVYETRVLPFPDPNARPEAGLDCRAVNTFLAQVRANDIAGGADPRTRYYGLVYEGDAGQSQHFMRGCAVSIPNVPDPSATASGPAGSSKWGWDDSGSYAGWYTAHEVGHTLGRRHVGGTCNETGIDRAFPFPNGRISQDSATFIGFDPGDTVEGKTLGPMVIPGRQAGERIGHDVMSYCKWQWVSTYTYNSVRQRLALEDRLGGGTPNGDMALVGGPSPTPAPTAVSSVPQPATRSATQPTRVADSRSQTQRKYLHVLVRLEDGWQSGTLVSLTPSAYSAASGAIPVPANSPVIETLGAGGRVLASIPVAVQAFTDGESDGLKPQSAGLINASIPIDNAVTGVRVVFAGKVLVEAQAGSAMPSLAPRAVTTERAAGTRAARPAAPLGPNDSISLQWDAATPAGRPVTYTVQLSTDGGGTWQTVATGLRETHLEVDPKALSGNRRAQRSAGTGLKYKVIASDGFNTTETTGDVN